MMRLTLMPCFAFAVLLGLASCSDDKDSSSDSSHKLNSLAYNVIDAGTLVHGGTSVSGTGSAVFVAPNKDEDNHYSLGFSLDDGGSLSIISNSANDLTTGISIKFSRNANTLSAFMKTDSEETDISSKFSDVDASGELSYHIDFHNDENPTHIIIWPDVTEYTEETAKFNSESDTEAPGQGKGNLWGLKLENATVKSALVSTVKFKEEE